MKAEYSNTNVCFFKGALDVTTYFIIFAHTTLPLVWCSHPVVVSLQIKYPPYSRDHFTRLNHSISLLPFTPSVLLNFLPYLLSF